MPAKSKASRRKGKPKRLKLADYIRRYGAPKKGTPRRAEYERSPAFKKRSRAAKRAYLKRLVGKALVPSLATFTQTRESGASYESIRKAHEKWIDASASVRPLVDRKEWRGILDRIGEELALDDDFVEALEESPEWEYA